MNALFERQIRQIVGQNNLDLNKIFYTIDNMIEDTREYYYTDDNNQVDGPHSFVHLMQLRQDGKIFDDTLVCQTGESNWISFGDVLTTEARKKRAEQAKSITKTPTPIKEENMQQPLPKSDKKEAGTSSCSDNTEVKSSIDKFKIANTGLLVIIAVLLAFQLITGNSSLPTTTATIAEDDSNDDKAEEQPTTPLVPVTIQASTTLPVSVTGLDIEYEYGAVRIDRENMAYAEKAHEENGGEFGPIKIPTHHLHIGGYKGWDYVGILCNDGINGSWILVRRKKEE